jgi:hypothetical protein
MLGLIGEVIDLGSGEPHPLTEGDVQAHSI